MFRCDGHARRVYLAWLAAIVLCFVAVAVARAMPAIAAGIVACIVVSGLLVTWYYARLLRQILNHTTAILQGAFGPDTPRFATSVTAGGLLWLVADNLLIAVATLGPGMPVVLHRHAKYVARTTYMSGTFDAGALAQSTLARPSIGEGFPRALDPGIV